MAQIEAQGEQNDLRQIPNNRASLDRPSNRADSGLNLAGDEDVNDQSQNHNRPPLYDRATRVSAVSGANFRVAKSLGLGNRNRKIGAAGEVVLPHVTTEQSATCGNPPLTHRDLITWAIGNYTVDPIQNSKNRWRIRIRCRKVGCVHSDHIGLKTISFVDDPVYRRIAKSERKYADWKKQIIAENATTLRQSN